MAVTVDSFHDIDIVHGEANVIDSEILPASIPIGRVPKYISIW